jgi:hypothetical protein
VKDSNYLKVKMGRPELSRLGRGTGRGGEALQDPRLAQNDDMFSSRAQSLAEGLTTMLSSLSSCSASTDDDGGIAVPLQRDCEAYKNRIASLPLRNASFQPRSRQSPELSDAAETTARGGVP